MALAINILFITSIVLSFIFLLFNFYEYFLFILGIFKKRKHKKDSFDYPERKKIAILIAAKNEASVIKDIINSLLNQTYNKDLYHIYLVADNCSDDTAAIAKKIGEQFKNQLTVLERFNNEYKGANFAIQFAIKYIQDQNITYDAYCYFDSDNIVDKNWLRKVANKLEEGYDVVTTYRNSLNFNDSWVSASYGIQFIKESSYINYSREKMNMTSWINGTGFCFTNRVLELTNNWDFNSLSHDIEFTQFLSLHNIKCGYANDAIFYDEQPTSLKNSYKQRIRWSKGFLQVFKMYGKNEAKSLFTQNKQKCKNKQSIQANFALIFPQVFLLFLNLILYITISIMLGCISSTEIPQLIMRPIDFWIVTPFLIFGGLYSMYLFWSLLVVIQERKSINCNLFKSICYSFLYPFFMMTYIPISLIGYCKKRVSTTPVCRQKRL